MVVLDISDIYRTLEDLTDDISAKHGGISPTMSHVLLESLVYATIHDFCLGDDTFWEGLAKYTYNATYDYLDSFIDEDEDNGTMTMCSSMPFDVHNLADLEDLSQAIADDIVDSISGYNLSRSRDFEDAAVKLRHKTYRTFRREVDMDDDFTINLRNRTVVHHGDKTKQSIITSVVENLFKGQRYENYRRAS